MLYFKIQDNKLVEISNEYQHGWINRRDFDGMDVAEVIARGATELTGERYIATDAGPHVSPRYDVTRAPAVGDKVSYAFNGDSYPDGEIVRVSASLKVVTTSTGSRFYRRKQSGSWVKGGTWSLVRGHVRKLNPEF